MNTIQRVRNWIIRHRTYSLRLSDDKSLYYVEALAEPWSFWLSNDELPMSDVDTFKKQIDEGGFTGSFLGGMTIKLKNGQEYWRKRYDFTFFKIHASNQLRERVKGSDNRVLDYIVAMNQTKSK